jgi:hypothetical protein
MGWVLPTNHSGTDTEYWSYPENAYDNDTDTIAYSIVGQGSWTGWMQLNRASILCSGVRFSAGEMSGPHSGLTIDIDLYYDGAWKDLFQGTFTYDTFITKTIGSNKNVTAMRIRFYNNTGQNPAMPLVREAHFYEVIPTAPSVTTNACTNVLAESVDGNGNITDDGAATVTERGFCYIEGDSGTPTTSNDKVYDIGSFGTGSFSKTISGLSPGTTYRVRAYAVNNEGTGYGTTVSVTTANAPTVTTTTPVTTKDHESATLGGEVTDADGQAITERGFQYEKITTGSTVDDDSAADQKVLKVTATTAFTEGNKVVINRGGAREEDGEIGSIQEGVSITLVDNLTYEHTAVQGDDVEICGTTNTESEEDTDFGEDTFSLEVTGLENYVTYRYRAYAVNPSGTGYGDWESFTTDKTTPTVTVNSMTDILPTTATANGNITSTGGEDCSERGFQYGLTKVATWSVKDDVGGYGVDDFSKGLTDLLPNTYYWIRAYAVNSEGTGYSEWLQFQTAAAGIIPTGTLINICSDYSGYTYKLMRSETDDGETYTAYFVISTDLANKQGLAYYKRILDMDLYFNNEDSGTATISVKRDNETSWVSLGSVSLAGDDDIIIKHLAVDVRAKHFLFKISASNHFEFLGVLFQFIPIGMR